MTADDVARWRAALAARRRQQRAGRWRRKPVITGIRAAGLNAADKVKRDRIEAALREDASRSNRQIADLLGVGPHLVIEVREKLCESHNIHRFEFTAGRGIRPGRHSASCWCGQGDTGSALMIPPMIAADDPGDDPGRSRGLPTEPIDGTQPRSASPGPERRHLPIIPADATLNPARPTRLMNPADDSQPMIPPDPQPTPADPPNPARPITIRDAETAHGRGGGVQRVRRERATPRSTQTYSALSEKDLER